MYSHVFAVLDEQDRVLFFLVKSARGGPLESVGSQFTANAVARHEDGEYLWAIRDTTQARVSLAWIERMAGIKREEVVAVVEKDLEADSGPVLASVTLPGRQQFFFCLAANGDAVTPVFSSGTEARAWLAGTGLPKLPPQPHSAFPLA